MNKLVLGTAALIVVIALGAVLYLSFRNLGHGTQSPYSNNSVISQSNSSHNSSSNSTISAALEDCANAGVSASQCQSYCMDNPPKCGLSGSQSGSNGHNTSSNQTNPYQAYQKVYVGKSVTLSQQFTVTLLKITYANNQSYAELNVSQGPYSRSLQIGQRQYVGFGQNGNGPYLLINQINSSGNSQGWAAINMSFNLVSGFIDSSNQNSSQNNNSSTGKRQNSSTAGQNSQGDIAYALPSCQNQTYLTALPTNLSSIAYITPLGSLNPEGGHPIPSDHGGIGLFTSGGHSLPASVYAPGNVHILQIVTQNSTINGKTFTDSLIYFAPCHQLVFYYGHVATLSSALQQKINNASKTAQCQTSQQSNATSTTCTYAFDYMAKAGEFLGIAGGPNTNILGFDFGGYDLRATALAFIDPARQFNDFGRPIDAICPYDYFSTSLQAVLYPKVQNTEKGANGSPSCGTDMEDIAGTIQGNWYANGSSSTGGAVWSQQLSIVHWYENLSIGVLAFGGTVAQASLNAFTPTNSGYVNREPSQVTADGQVYCYYPNNLNTAYGLSPLSEGHFDLQLMDSNTLKIEYQNGSCPQNPTFTNPIIYIR
ncbi:MAG TPA: hypothetical protein VND15_02025 [Candidatus Acidoferrales bacterium]|nr:hypothetical protein [Candidatus Acidoferrales bacterium]